MVNGILTHQQGRAIDILFEDSKCAFRQRNSKPARLGIFKLEHDHDFFVRFTDYLDANEDLAHRLVFEFTYPALEIMHDRVAKNLQAVADRGYVFSIDHVRRFDRNWSSLRQKNFRYIKVTSELLLAESARGEDGAKLVQAFKDNLHQNEIDLIVEKIESEAQVSQLNELGIDFGQGALLGRPKIADQYLQPGVKLAAAS